MFTLCLSKKMFQLIMAMLVGLHCRPPWVALTKQAQCKFLDKLLKLPNAPQIKVSPQHATSLVPALILSCLSAGLEEEALSVACPTVAAADRGACACVQP